MNNLFLKRLRQHIASYAVKKSITILTMSLAVFGLSGNSYAADQCNWYGTTYGVCATTQSGWGWENNVSCISRSTCSAQPAPYGIVASSSSTTSFPNCASAASDPDGDGWGWENNQSCIVVKSSSSRSSSFPNCASAASDPDGDGWGWENNQSCIVVKTSSSKSSVRSSSSRAVSSSSTAFPACTSSTSDPDGDGWGWENNRSCQVVLAPNGYPYCSSSAADPDGDGWGWENNQSCMVKASSTQTGLHVSGRYLVDGNGTRVVLRAPELVHRWGVYSGITYLGMDVAWEGGKNNNVGSNTIREMAKTGANAIRILGGIGNELDDMLRTAIVEQKMFVSVGRVDWTNAQMRATLQKYSKYLILHPRGEFTHHDPVLWRTEAIKVIKELRALGYTSPIEVGTTGYGQNWATIKQYGVEVAATDPLKNTLFMTQLYSEYAKNVTGTLNEIAAFSSPVNVGACLFTSTYGNTPNTYKEVWDQTMQRNLSSFYWDWWGDGEGNSMTTNGTINNLTSVGRYLIHDSPAALKYSVKTPFLLNANVP